VKEPVRSISKCSPPVRDGGGDSKGRCSLFGAVEDVVEEEGNNIINWNRLKKKSPDRCVGDVMFMEWV